MEDEKSKNYPHKWTQLGNASTRLLGEAEAMYWRAMKLEIASIVYALHEILAKKDGIPELVEGSPEYLNDSQRLSIRIIPYMKDWCECN